MADLNKVILIGRLTHDPDLRFIPSGSAVCTFSLAVNRSFKNKEGNRETDFFNVTAWQKLAETCGKFLSRGSQVALHGRIQIRPYETSTGEKRKATEIIAENVQFLDGFKGRDRDQATAPAEQRETRDIGEKPAATMAPIQNKAPVENEFSNDDLGIDPDDIPF
ncbi:MAG: single-stranded DNA-binding protein [Gemmatimonadota bacterium]|nr:single-stranded DNA-binding protein [Gemmatimonadota bacterium]